MLLLELFSSDNNLYSKLVSLGVGSLGDSTSRTFITRQPDSRSSEDRIYKYRYVIPVTFRYWNC